jgi:hypothetical protein
MRALELHLHDIGEGQRRIRLGEHADLHPEFGLGIDRATHDRAGPANLLVKRVVDFHNAHGIL